MKTTAATTPPSQPSAEFQHRAAWRAGVLGAINVLAIVLAVRLILLIAIVGAFYLTVIAIREPDLLRLAALGIYSVIIVGPLTWLSSRR